MEDNFGVGHGRCQRSRIQYRTFNQFDVFQKQLLDPFDGINILEAAGSLHEGLLYGLSLAQLSNRLDIPVLIVHLWEDSRSVDDLLEAKNQLGDNFAGVVLTI